MLPSARATVRQNRYGTSFTDPFTEQDNALVRRPWQMVSGEPGLKVVGNKAVPVSAAGTESRMCRRLPEGAASWTVTVTYGNLTGSAHQGISFIDAAPGDGADHGAIFIDASSSGIAVYVHPQTGGFNNQYFTPAVPSAGSVVTYLLTRSGDTFTLKSNGTTIATFTATISQVPRIGRAIHLWNSTGGGSFDDVTVTTGYTFTDNFDRANGALGSPWTTPHGGTWTVTSNQALMTLRPGDGSEPIAIVSVLSSLAIDLQADLVVGVHPGASLIFNYLSPGNFHMLNISPGSSSLYKFTAGSATAIATPAMSGNGTYRVVTTAAGGVSYYKNGVLIGTSSTTWHPGGYGVGIQSAVAGQNPSDNFAAIGF